MYESTPGEEFSHSQASPVFVLQFTFTIIHSSRRMENKQTNKQANKHASKQANKQTSKQTNKQTKQDKAWNIHHVNDVRWAFIMQMMSGGRKVAVGKKGAILQNNALSFVQALHGWSGHQTIVWSKLPPPWLVRNSLASILRILLRT